MGKNKKILKNSLIALLIASSLFFLPKKAKSSGYVDIVGSYNKNLTNNIDAGKFSLESEIYREGQDKSGFFNFDWTKNSVNESAINARVNIICFNPFSDKKEILLYDNISQLGGIYGDRTENAASITLPFGNIFLKYDFEYGKGNIANMDYSSSGNLYSAGGIIENKDSSVDIGVSYRLGKQKFGKTEVGSDSWIFDFNYNFGPECMQYNPNNNFGISLDSQAGDNEKILKTEIKTRLTPLQIDKIKICDEAKIKYTNITNFTDSTGNENNVEAKFVFNNLIAGIDYSSTTCSKKLGGGIGYRINLK